MITFNELEKIKTLNINKIGENGKYVDFYFFYHNYCPSCLKSKNEIEKLVNNLIEKKSDYLKILTNNCLRINFIDTIKENNKKYKHFNIINVPTFIMKLDDENSYRLFNNINKTAEKLENFIKLFIYRSFTNTN